MELKKPDRLNRAIEQTIRGLESRLDHAFISNGCMELKKTKTNRLNRAIEQTIRSLQIRFDRTIRSNDCLNLNKACRFYRLIQ